MDKDNKEIVVDEASMVKYEPNNASGFAEQLVILGDDVQDSANSDIMERFLRCERRVMPDIDIDILPRNKMIEGK